MSETKAAAAEKKAEAALQKGFFSFMSSDAQRAENAADHYAEAAAQYKMMSEFTRAAELFVKVAEMHKTAGNKTQISEAYKNASTLFKQGGDSKRAVQYNTILARLFEERNQTNQAAKIYAELGELNVERKQVADAIVAYENAIRCRVILDQKVHENEMKEKLAELCASTEGGDRYEKAVQLFEDVAEPVKGRVNYKAPNFYWKALLCRMVMEVQKTADIKESNADFMRYQELCPQFNQGATRRNVSLLEELYTQFAAESIDGFEVALQTFRANGGVLTPWDVNMLTKVKDSLDNPVVKTPEPTGGQPDSDDEFT
jgi:tetratricopeptide (TPR) repeat protein